MQQLVLLTLPPVPCDLLATSACPTRAIAPSRSWQVGLGVNRKLADVLPAIDVLLAPPPPPLLLCPWLRGPMPPRSVCRVPHQSPSPRGAAGCAGLHYMALRQQLIQALHTIASPGARGRRLLPPLTATLRRRDLVIRRPDGSIRWSGGLIRQTCVLGDGESQTAEPGYRFSPPLYLISPY